MPLNEQRIIASRIIHASRFSNVPEYIALANLPGWLKIARPGTYQGTNRVGRCWQDQHVHRVCAGLLNDLCYINL